MSSDIMKMEEGQNIEYKRIWKDEYLQWICGFANAQGGKLYIGIDDDQTIVGLKNVHRFMEDIPNKIVSALGIVCDVNLHEQGDKQYIEIVVTPSNMPIAYKGEYHYRSGATKQQLKGVALQEFILKKMGRSWDDTLIENSSLEMIDREAIEYFLRQGVKRKRLSPEALSYSTEKVLENLQLITDDGKLNNAAILLFGKNPQKSFVSSIFRIGRFGKNESDLISQDTIEGNIIQMADRIIDVLKNKYLISPVHYEGMVRVEPLEIPEDALREILYNAICHKDYSGSHIQMRVFNDRITLWNPGMLPMGLTIEDLLVEHSSQPRNKLLANAFFKAGFIETWGRGINKIKEEFEKVKLDLPIFEEKQGGFMVTINRAKDVQRILGIPSSTPQVSPMYPPSTPHVDKLLLTFGIEYLSIAEIMTLMGLRDRKSFRANYLNPAIDKGFVEMLYPEQVKHPKQKYRLTVMGLGYRDTLQAKQDR